MPRKPDYQSWINNDSAQIEWANSYLSQRGLGRPIAKDPENHQVTLSSFIEGRLYQGPKGIYFVQRMRSAWKQKELRDNRKGQKAYNFVLRAEVETQLDSLSKKLSAPKNEVVAAAILSYNKNKKELVRIKKEASHLRKTKLEKELEYQNNRNGELENRHNEWLQKKQELQAEITDLKEQVDRLKAHNLELMQAQQEQP